MSMTDPIADMLTQIRNAQTARKPSITLPALSVASGVSVYVPSVRLTEGPVAVQAVVPEAENVVEATCHEEPFQ